MNYSKRKRSINLPVKSPTLSLMDQNRINLYHRLSSNLSIYQLPSNIKDSMSSIPLGLQFQLCYLAQQAEICPKFHLLGYIYHSSPWGFSPSCKSHNLFLVGNQPSRNSDTVQREVHNFIIKTAWNTTLYFLGPSESPNTHFSQNNSFTIPQPVWCCSGQ